VWPVVALAWLELPLPGLAYGLSLLCLSARILSVHRMRQPDVVLGIVRRNLGHAIVGVRFVRLDGNEQVAVG